MGFGTLVPCPGLGTEWDTGQVTLVSPRATCWTALLWEGEAAVRKRKRKSVGWCFPICVDGDIGRVPGAVQGPPVTSHPRRGFWGCPEELGLVGFLLFPPFLT